MFVSFFLCVCVNNTAYRGKNVDFVQQKYAWIARKKEKTSKNTLEETHNNNEYF